MKRLGLKKLLLLFVILLVGLSVSLSSMVLYLQGKDILTNTIKRESQLYASSKAAVIETMISEKVNGIHKLATQYKNKPLQGTEEALIEQTKFLANAMNLPSAVIALETGDAYWNQTAKSWPNHKLAVDVRTKSWYQDGRNAPGVTVTEPYSGAGDSYWITIIEKMKGGAIMTDMTLDFLDDIVKSVNDMPGAVALILNQDSTVLASSSKAVKTGEKATDFPWLKEAAQQALSQQSATINYTLDGEDKILFSHRIQAGDKNWYFAIGLSESVAFSELAQSRNSAILVTTIAVIISVLAAYALIQMIYRPVLSLKETVLSLSSGDADLTQRLKVDTDDELGQISQGVNKFIENLQNMMLEITRATTSLQGNAEQMRNRSRENSDIIQNHVSETEQIAAAIEEMNATANAMATDAANTANLTQQANETSIESRKIVTQSQETVSALITDVNKSVDDVQTMNDETQNINSILKVIGDIAEQTNLLALNAAIEAARAGEQGRGFAVVADEVRNLASRTKSSTEEIETALENLLKGTKFVVSSMDNTKGRCQETADSSGQVAESLETMTNYVDEISELSSQIATAAREQSSVTQELSQNMTAISDIVVQLDSNGKQVLQDAEEVTKINQSLVSIVNQFKI